MKKSPEYAEIDPIYGSLVTQHGMGGIGVERLLGRFGDAAGVYAAGPEACKETHPRLSPAAVDSLRRGPNLKAWEALAAQCRDLGITVTAPGRADYPEPLRALPGPPPLLFMRGLWLPQDARAVALVGTRGPTDYGRRAAFTLARDFAGAGFTVVSGLAAGIDGAAHEGAMAAPSREGALAAMEGGGRTIAVIGCGLDIPYPAENLAVRARMEENDCARGLIVSEFPPGTEPRAGHFPRRNRLISALAQAVVVVEAGGKSGALLTAAYGRDQGRPLFAVPGPIFSAVSTGTTALLRRGALPAASIQDVIRVVDGNAPARRIPSPEGTDFAEEDGTSKSNRSASRKRKKIPRKTREEAAQDPVTALWENEDACGLDALAARAVARGLWPVEKASGALLERLLHLELQGRVRRLPGAIYRRAR